MLYNPLARWGSLRCASPSDRSLNRPGRAFSRRRRTAVIIERLEERTLLSFTPIAQPDAAYTGGTTNLASHIPADGTALTSLSDGTETITFSSTVTAATVPSTFTTWGSPPATESSTPRVLVD